MPSRPDTALDERYEELAALIRAARPHASEHLRERVRELAAGEPAPVSRRTVAPRARRLAFALVPALIVAAVLGVSIAGLRSVDGTSGGDQEAASEGKTTLPFEAQQTPTFDSSAQPAVGAGAAREALPPTGDRAQNYRAELTVLVPDVDSLSSATADAMRATRRLGGFVVRADFDTPGDDEGDSLLVVRVPVGRVQDAIARFSELGTIVGQRIAIEDLEVGLDQQRREIEALRGRIARLERELAEPGLTDEARSELRLRLLESRRQLTARTRGVQGTQRRAATARVSLTLTTRERAETPQPPVEPGYFERTVRDAASVLGRVLTWFLAATIVLSPVLVLGVLAVLLEGRRRRAAEARLLEQV